MSKLTRKTAPASLLNQKPRSMDVEDQSTTMVVRPTNVPVELKTFSKTQANLLRLATLETVARVEGYPIETIRASKTRNKENRPFPEPKGTLIKSAREEGQKGVGSLLYDVVDVVAWIREAERDNVLTRRKRTKTSVDPKPHDNRRDGPMRRNMENLERELRNK